MATVTQPYWSIRHGDAAPSDAATVSTAGEVPVLARCIGEWFVGRPGETEAAVSTRFRQDAASTRHMNPR